MFHCHSFRSLFLRLSAMLPLSFWYPLRWCACAGMRLFVCLIAIAPRPLSDFVIASRLLLSYFFPNLFNFVSGIFCCHFGRLSAAPPPFRPFFGLGLGLVICCSCLLSRQLKAKLAHSLRIAEWAWGIFSFQHSIRLFSHIPLIHFTCCLPPLCLFAFCLQFAWAIII